MKIATFLPNMTDVQEPEQEELNENHIPPKLRALPVSAVLHLAKPRRMGKARKKIITPLRSLRKNLATLAVPYLPSSVPKSPLAPRTKGYRPQLRTSDFLLPYFLICLLYPYMPYMVKKLWGLGYLAPEPVEGSLSKGACRRKPVLPHAKLRRIRRERKRIITSWRLLRKKLSDPCGYCSSFAILTPPFYVSVTCKKVIHKHEYYLLKYHKIYVYVFWYCGSQIRLFNILLRLIVKA